MEDWIDQIFLAKAKEHMVHFNLESFRTTYPSLYATIRESIKQASNPHVSQRQN